MTLQKSIWALQRTLFTIYIVTTTFTVIGGVVTAPLLTHLFFRDWRFWKYFKQSWGLFFHAWQLMPLVAKGENGGFMFNVPLTAPPLTSPDLTLSAIRSDWKAGKSCGDCMRCCDKISCPLLDKKTTLCAGYDSPFWRFFNCGWFPTTHSELSYYACPKWELQPLPWENPAPNPIGEDALQLD